MSSSYYLRSQGISRSEIQHSNQRLFSSPFLSEILSFEKEHKINYENDYRENYKGKEHFSYSHQMKKLKITKFPSASDKSYLTLENNGQNSCYVNVVLHLFYHCKELREALINFYNNNAFIKANKTNEKVGLISKVGEIMNIFNNFYLNTKEKNVIETMDTNKFREILASLSEQKFQYGVINDPLDLMSFLFDYITITLGNNVIINSEDIFSAVKVCFNLKLKEQIFCSRHKKETMYTNEYDNEAYFHQIYVSEIIKNIEYNAVKHSNYLGNLFKMINYSYSEDERRCGVCGGKCNKLIYLDKHLPIYLLINCVWDNKLPDIDDVLKFIFMINTEDSIQNLFNINKNYIENPSLKNYNLNGIIFFNYKRCHYIIVLYDAALDIYTIYNDVNIGEYRTLKEVYYKLIIEEVQNLGSELFFYPVLLIYSNNKTNAIRRNPLNLKDYLDMSKICGEIKAGERNAIERKDSEMAKRMQLELNENFSEEQQFSEYYRRTSSNMKGNQSRINNNTSVSNKPEPIRDSQTPFGDDSREAPTPGYTPDLKSKGSRTRLKDRSNNAGDKGKISSVKDNLSYIFKDQKIQRILNSKDESGNYLMGENAWKNLGKGRRGDGEIKEIRLASGKDKTEDSNRTNMENTGGLDKSYLNSIRYQSNKDYNLRQSRVSNNKEEDVKEVNKSTIQGNKGSRYIYRK